MTCLSRGRPQGEPTSNNIDTILSDTGCVTVLDIALDLRFLSCAVLVAKHGSIRRAAGMLDLSQTTVSRRIQHLETRLGVTLFIRNRMGVRTTPAGERFIRDAAVGAKHLRRAVNDVRAAQNQSEGELRIGLMASLAGGLLSNLLEAYHSYFPKIDVILEEGGSQAIAAGIGTGRLDASFVPSDLQLAGYEAKRLWSEQVYAAIPNSNPLAENTFVEWKDLQEETFLVPAEFYGPEVEARIIRNLSYPGFRPKILVQDVGRENLLNLVGMGFGLSLATSSTLALPYPGVSFVPFGNGGEHVGISVVWASENVNPALSRLLELTNSLPTRP